MTDCTRIGIVVEGDTDRRLLNSCRTWFRDQGFDPKVAQANGRPRLIHEAQQHLAMMRLKDCERIYFLIDQHDDPCPPWTAALLNPVRSEPDVVVCVVARDLEAWLLADIEAVTRATGQSFSALPTDELDQPTRTLKDLFRRKRNKFPTKGEMVKSLAPHFDFDRPSEGNRSLRRFLVKLRT